MDSMKENSKGTTSSAFALNAIQENNDRRTLGKRDCEVEALLQTVQMLETKLAKSESIIEHQKRAKSRIIENIKTKRNLLEASHAAQTKLQLEVVSLQNQNNQLHHDLNLATTARDTAKNKLRLQNESSKECKAKLHALQKECTHAKKVSTLQADLLKEFRRLSLHTGFYKWGKPIRALEHALAAAEQDPADEL